MPTYKCSRCHKVFKQKCHYDNHKKRKIPCEEKEEEQQIPKPKPEPEPERKLIWMSIAGKNYFVPEKTVEEDEQAVEVAKGETAEQALRRFYEWA
jgi:hypothetical protein